MRRVQGVVLSVVALMLMVVLAACSSSPPTGSMQVTLSGLPSGVSGSVTVTGPGGYSKTITTTTTLSSLALGTYSVAAAAVSNGNSIVPTMYDGSASSSTLDVQQNKTVSTTVSYTSRPGSGHLWKAVWPDAAASFSSASLGSGSSTPDVTLTSPSNEGEGVAFDHAGNLWVADWGGYIYQYGVAQLDGSGATTPVKTIDATAYGPLAWLAFDAAGNLWVAAYSNSQVLEFTPAQLAAGGVQTPAVVIKANGTPSLAGPDGLAFDASGNLWVANSNGPNTVVEFTPAQLAAGGVQTPAVTISPTGTPPTLSRPGGLAFDPSGNLWVANLTGTTVVRYSAAQLTSPGGSLTPAATIGTSSFASSGGPWGLAFDASGALWVAETYAQDLRRFTSPDSLTGTVTPAPDTTISSVPPGDFAQIAFSPPPANVPIHTP